MNGPVKIVTRVVEVDVTGDGASPEGGTTARREFMLDDLPPAARVIAVKWGGTYLADAKHHRVMRRVTVTLAIEGGVT